MPQSFLLGPLKINFYGLFVGLGVLFSYWYSSKKADSFGFSQKQIDRIYLISCFFALIGARIYHLLDAWQIYKNNIQAIFLVNNGGLGIFGAIIGTFDGIVVSTKILKINLKMVLNLVFPSLLLSQSVGRIGNLFNQETFGSPTNLPGGIKVNGLIYHPVFLYESIFCLISFFIYTRLQKNSKKHFGFAYYLISYGSIRFFTEFLRLDTWKMNNIHIAHLLSLLMIISGVFLFKKKCS